MCIFSTICDNGRDVFKVEAGEDFHCQMSTEGVQRLRSLLTTEAAIYEPKSEASNDDDY